MTLNRYATLASRPAMADERSGDGNRKYRWRAPTFEIMMLQTRRVLRVIIV
jgi:hypothetical protein